jgi:hypothetical protein
MKNARVVVGLVLGLSGAGCIGEGASPSAPDIESVEGAVITNAKINIGGLSVAATGGVGGNTAFAADPGPSGVGGGAGSVKFQVVNAISVNGVTFAAPQAVYQDARLGTFTYKATGFNANTPVAVNLHFAEINANVPVGGRLFKVTVNNATVESSLDIVKVTGGTFRAMVEQVLANTGTSGTVTIMITALKGSRVTQGLLSAYEVFPIDCGKPPKPVGGNTTTFTKTTPGGVATYHCPSTDILVGNATTTCTQGLGTQASWTPSAVPVCLVKNGQACSPSNACASGICVGNVCCGTTCGDLCDTGVCGSDGNCVHKDNGTLCKVVVGSSPGNNDFQLFCHGGACDGPVFTCGLSGTACASDGNTACCARAIVDGGTTTWTPKECGLASTCAGNYGENCLNSSDCPTNEECCFSGGYGFGWSVCVAAGTCDAGRQVCDPSRPIDCPTGTTCQGYNGTENTCQ